MTKKRATKAEPELEAVAEIEDEKVEILKLDPPCQIEIPVKEFDKRVLDGYSWRESGRLWRGRQEILVIGVSSYA